MKSTIAILATLVILAAVAPAGAQDWVLDWISTGNVVTQPFTWRITDTSPQTSLIPVSTPPSLPPNFNGHVWALGFVWPTSGQSYGGLVAEGAQFQTSAWAVRAP
jgi:hypothetical protein